MPAQPARREFVKAAAAAIATSQFPILGANDRINVGIVGLGGRGTNHIEYYSQLDADARIAALCDVNQSARERAVAAVKKAKGYQPKEYADMRTLFESKDVDAVSLPLPNHWHALATIWACQAGKDVYVEKPACHNVYEGRQMVNAVRQYGRVLQTGSMQRSYANTFRQACELVRSGYIGKIKEVYVKVGGPPAECHLPTEPIPKGMDWDMWE